MLDRATVAALGIGFVAVQFLMFSAGWLVGATSDVQAVTPPAAPLPVRASPPVPAERETVRLASLRRGGSLAVEESGPLLLALAAPSGVERPSPLAAASFVLPPPKVKAERKPAPVLPRSAVSYTALIRDAASRHSVSASLVEAIARVESGFNPRAVSKKGARGLMQVMPATGRRFGVRSDRLFEPEHNLAVGVAYLAWLSKRYSGDLDRVIAAYNAGEGAVDDHGGVPPYRETRDYVRRVRAALSSIEEKALAARPPREADLGTLAVAPGTLPVSSETLPAALSGSPLRGWR